ncbi:MAG: histidine kinase [Pseudomonadota bacterium]
MASPSPILQDLLNEPRAPSAPVRVWRDWALVGVLLPLVALETTLTPDLLWQPLPTVLVILQVLTLLWRRSQPLIMLLIALVPSTVIQQMAHSSGLSWTGLDTGACILILPYALLRWGSGRGAVLGLLVLGLYFGVVMRAEARGIGEVLGASLFFLFPAALGAAIRYQDSAQRRALIQSRLSEREQLARELHDTVAHHVSAIAVQAQAGQAVAAGSNSAPVESLVAIEEAASQTLNDMRRLVSALRDEEHSGGIAPRAPAATLADIDRLAGVDSSGLTVQIRRPDDLDGLSGPILNTLVRLAQEGITNARRHARAATCVQLTLEVQTTSLRFVIKDDGRSRLRPTAAPGYGLRGMAERVSLLGGTFDAGPVNGGGWRVVATLPRDGRSG